MEVLKGYVSSIVFRNSDNGYSVFRFVTDDNEETAVGIFPILNEGEMLELSGDFVMHPVYDRQFKVASSRTIEPEDEIAMIRYLGSGIIKGIGPTLAGRIVDAFGNDSFRVIEEEPERLAEVKGITLEKAREIGILMNEKRGFRDAMMYMQKFGIGNTLALKIYNYYGDRIYKLLQENPYKVAEDIPGVGFKTADDIAEKIGILRDSDYRIRSGIIYTLLLATGQGHLYLPQGILIRRTAEILDVPLEAVKPHILNLAVDKKIIIVNTENPEEPSVYAETNYFAENSIAGMLRNLNVDFMQDEQINDDMARKSINVIAKEKEMILDDLQQQAVLLAVKNGISIISGGPGTGKTTTINMIIGYFEKQGQDIILAAPTGRAAKRMTEATGYEARTLHRVLELGGVMDEDNSGAKFERNELNPLEADVIIVDEMSMVDVFLFRALLKAIPPGSRLIMVGDVNQLPSIGPGQVLRDLIESKCFPVTILQKIFRQAGESDIVVNAHRINQGESIQMDNKSRDFFFLKRNDANNICLNIVDLITKNLPPYVGAESFDIQVLTPTRKGSLGVEALNRYLQEKLNPPAKNKAEHEYGEGVFREGDKVMQVKNNYQAEWEIVSKYNIPIDAGIGIFNGDMGRILSINANMSVLKVEFDDGRRVDYPFTQLDELELAYAITIHKAQGSEYAAVVMPVMSGPRQLMNRNLLYTGVTRAKKCLVMLGNPETAEEMIANSSENRRYSGLKDRVYEIMNQ